MKHSQEEILKALHVIKEVCDDFFGCVGCPFERNEECLITDGPPDWLINDEPPAMWKGLL